MRKNCDFTNDLPYHSRGFDNESRICWNIQNIPRDFTEQMRRFQNKSVNKNQKTSDTKSKLSFRLILEYPDPKMSLDEKFVSLQCTQ